MVRHPDATDFDAGEPWAVMGDDLARSGGAKKEGAAAAYTLWFLTVSKALARVCEHVIGAATHAVKKRRSIQAEAKFGELD